MIRPILTQAIVGLSDFKASPMRVMQASEGSAVAVLHDDKPLFYAVPAERYEAIMDALEDLHDLQVANDRLGDAAIPIKFEDL